LEHLCQKRQFSFQTPVDSTGLHWSPGGVFKQWTPGGVENLVDSGGLHWSPPEFVELGVSIKVRIGLEAI